MNYVKTDAGQQAFRERSALFSARQRAAFILFDGVKSIEQVLASTANLGITRPDIEHMVTQGFLEDSASAGVPEAAAAALTAPPASPALPARTETATATSIPAAAAPLPAPREAAEGATPRTPQERYGAAKPLATQLTASLGLRGFMLNLGVESASGYDDLLALFPKIQAVLGAKKCEALERALKG